MNNNDENNDKSGIGFWGLLTIVFITLKLCGVIQWNWLWVLAPLWIPVVIALLIGAVILIVTKVKYKNIGGRHERKI